MKNQKHIKSFIFDYAQYQLGDNSNGSVLLQVDYTNNKYKLKSTGVVNHSLDTEAKKIARDLLKRKHGVNFANKL
jgi:hypothetical protein